MIGKALRAPHSGVQNIPLPVSMSGIQTPTHILSGADRESNVEVPEGETEKMKVKFARSAALLPRGGKGTEKMDSP